VHQLFSFFDLGFVMTELPRDDLHSAGDLFLQAGLTLSFSATLATTGPLNARGILGLVECGRGLTSPGTGCPGFGCGGLTLEVL